MRSLSLIFGLGLIAPNAVAADNLFDPSGYIEDQAQLEAAKATKLTGKSIYRINGRRFQKLMSVEGAVYLPSDGSMPEVVEELALCNAHMRLMSEVIPVRENMEIEPAILKYEPAILDMIRKCKDGAIKGPTLVIETPNGAQIEVKAKDKKDEIKEKGTESGN